MTKQPGRRAASTLLPAGRRRKSERMTRARFTAVFERHGRWYVGYVPEVPGVNAQERTLAAARRSLGTALRELAKLDPTALRGRGRRIEQIEIRLTA